jgi:hypothetical protein
MLSTMNCNNLNAGGLFEICIAVLCLPVCKVVVTPLAYYVSGVLCLKLFFMNGELVTTEMQLLFDLYRLQCGDGLMVPTVVATVSRSRVTSTPN